MAQPVQSSADVVSAVGRVGLALIFLLAAISKITALEATQGYIASAGLPLPQMAYWVAVPIELLGGAALALGFRTHAVAAVLAAFCVATALAFHTQFADQNQMTDFLKNIAMAGGLLQLVVFGGGSLSLDNVRKKKHDHRDYRDWQDRIDDRQASCKRRREGDPHRS